MILPEELYEIIKGDFFTENTKPSYSRVILSLSAILEGEFFNEYIKKGIITVSFALRAYMTTKLTLSGNILMLSEGRTGVDKVYSLREGKTAKFSMKLGADLNDRDIDTLSGQRKL